MYQIITQSSVRRRENDITGPLFRIQDHTFLVLLHKPRNKKQCHNNVSEKLRVYKYTNSVRFSTQPWCSCKKRFIFKKHLLRSKRPMTSTPPSIFIAVHNNDYHTLTPQVLRNGWIAPVVVCTLNRWNISALFRSNSKFACYFLVAWKFIPFDQY